MQRIAQRRGKDIGEVVNELVRKEVEVIEEFS